MSRSSSEHRKGLLAQPRFRWKASGYLVRCLVKLKRTEEAVQEVQKTKHRQSDPVLRLLAHAAHGGAGAAVAEADKIRPQSHLLVQCYRDPDLGPLLRSDPFRSFRERFPEPKDNATMDR